MATPAAAMENTHLPTSSTVAVVCIGMAGSGKTTFMQRINSYLHTQRTPPYVINLDPAVRTVPFEANIDIRESIDYKEVMKQYNLGPNGGILTSLNLFATKVDQILEILEKRCGVKPPGGDDESNTVTSTASAPASIASVPPTRPSPQQTKPSNSNPPISHILLDTPGQIEVFVWSASGQILLSSLASTFPTVIAYIIDTPRTASTSTFMSNMLYACSILYKTKLPMILVFNKTDVHDAAFAKEWMTDFEAFQAALRREEETGSFGGAPEGGYNNDESSPYGGLSGGGGGGGSGYMSSLLNSMSLVLDEFYRALSVVGVSSMTGAGIPEFFAAVEEKKQEFERDYRPELERRRAEKVRDQANRREKDLGRLMEDLNVEGGSRNSRPRGTMGRPRRKQEPETISDLEDNDDEDDDDDDDRYDNEEERDFDMPDQPDAELVEPDGPSSPSSSDPDRDRDTSDPRNSEGLTTRYKRALDDQHTVDRPGGDGAPDPEDFSFARYIHQANVNR